MSRVWDHTPKAKVDSLRPFGGEILPLEQDDVDYFQKRYELDMLTAAVYIKLAPTTQRYVLPILSPEGWIRGLVLRVPWPEAPRTVYSPVHALPKADTYMSRYEPVQSFYKASWGNREQLVVVEDQLSAIKLVEFGIDSVAMLGTPWSKDPRGFQHADRVSEIAREANGREVIVAFDADATDTAFEFARKWGSSFRRTRVAILERDLKDTPGQDFGRILGV